MIQDHDIADRKALDPHGLFAVQKWCLVSLVVTIGLLQFGLPVRGQETGGLTDNQDVATAIAVLNSDASRQDKLNACRRLAALGGAEVVPTLAPLLSDDQLSHPARLALEAIPDPAAGEALRLALPRLEGELLVGVINSLAARRQENAVQDLRPYLTTADPQVAAAACTALGTIASPDALRLLEQALPTVADQVRPAWGNAALRGVAALREEGLSDQAFQLCQQVQQADLPSHLQLAAARHAMLIRPQQAVTMLPQLLTSPDEDAFALALTVSRELDSPQVSDVLMANLANLPAKRQIQVILALADRDGQVAGGASAVPALIPLLEDPDQETRLAAVQALGQVIGVEELSVLTSRLLNVPDGAERRAIQSALVAACRRMPGSDPCARQLQTIVPAADTETKVFLIELLGLVGSETALDAVARLARQPQEEVQDAATRVLGQWRTPDVAPVLLELAQNALQAKFRIRALRGYLRVVRQMDLPARDRLTMTRQALDVATRAEERRLALELLREIPSVKSLDVAVKWLPQPDVQQTAATVVVDIAARLMGDANALDAISKEERARLRSTLEQVMSLAPDAGLAARAQGLLERSAETDDR